MTIFNKGLLQLKIKDMYRFICDDSRLTVNDQHSTFKCLGTLGIHIQLTILYLIEFPLLPCNGNQYLPVSAF